jgi:hypothetical protein
MPNHSAQRPREERPGQSRHTAAIFPAGATPTRVIYTNLGRYAVIQIRYHILAEKRVEKKSMIHNISVIFINFLLSSNFHHISKILSIQV